jgi:hypothetical protein
MDENPEGPKEPEAPTPIRAPDSATQPPATQPPAAEASREEKIAAARAKAEALKAQRAAAGTASPPGTPGAPAQKASAASGPGGAARPAPAAGPRAWATSENPGGQPAAPPQNPKVQAFGTITQSVELRCDKSEDQNFVRLLGGLGAYRNPLRGVWQLDYRYYAEALKRLQAAGYQVEGRDYLGRPLEKWQPETRGWTRL